MIEMPIGWLSPTGEMVKCDTFEHITIAFNLADKYSFNYNKHDNHDQEINHE